MLIIWKWLFIAVGFVADIGIVNSQFPTGMCLNYGCDSSQSYSQFTFNGQQVPHSNLEALWSNAYSGAFGLNYLGCVAVPDLIVCPATRPMSNSLIGINASSGTLLWADEVFRVPLLPLMDTYGDMIVTDGLKIGPMLPNGTVPTFDKILSNLVRPLYSPIITADDIYFVASENGELITYYSDGIPHASFYLNATVLGVKGCFTPVAQPAVAGHRAYLLTQFTPESRSKMVSCRRLVAFDILPQMAPRDVVMWTLDLDKGCFEDDTNNSTYVKSQGVYGNTTDPVLVKHKHIYLSLAHTRYSPAADGDGRYVLIIEDRGTSGQFSELLKFSANQFVTTSAPFYNGTDVWAVDVLQGKLLGFELEPTSPSVTVDLNALLSGNVSITSKVTILSEEPDEKLPVDDIPQLLVMGVSVKTSSRQGSLLGAPSSAKDVQNYLVAVDTRPGQDPLLAWTVPTPKGCSVRGQIVLVLPNDARQKHVAGQNQTATIVAYCDGDDVGIFFMVGSKE